MKYVFLIDSEEFGPISSQELIELVEDGRVLPETSVRNSMIKQWHKASDYDFLLEPLANKKAELQSESVKDTCKKTKKQNLQKISLDKDDSEDPPNGHSSYKNSFLPNMSPASLRLVATLFDYLLLSIVALMLFTTATLVSLSYEHYTNIIFYIFIFTAFSFWIVYFTVSFGLFAQTFGMWFWGILIVCNGDDAKPVYLGKAFVYTLLMFIFGVFSPFILYISNKQRALHDILTGTQIVRISAHNK